MSFCALGAIAWASGSDDLIKRGVELRREGRDGQALELFRRANEIDHGARSLAQMGLAEQALGIWTEAEAHITAALARVNEPWIDKNRIVIQKALGVVASHLGSLDVWGTPAGGQVLIDGKQVGVLPLSAPLRTTAGTVEIRVRAEGFVELARVVEVVANRTARERFELPKKAPPQFGAKEESAAPGTRAVTEGQLVGLQPETVRRTQAGQAIWKRWWFWTVLGAVAIGAGATAFVLTRPNDCPIGQCATIGQ